MDNQSGSKENRVEKKKSQLSDPSPCGICQEESISKRLRENPVEKKKSQLSDPSTCGKCQEESISKRLRELSHCVKNCKELSNCIRNRKGISNCRKSQEAFVCEKCEELEQPVCPKCIDKLTNIKCQEQSICRKCQEQSTGCTSQDNFRNSRCPERSVCDRCPEQSECVERQEKCECVERQEQPECLGRQEQSECVGRQEQSECVGRQEQSTCRQSVGSQEQSTCRQSIGRQEQSTCRQCVGRQEQSTCRQCCGQSTSRTCPTLPIYTKCKNSIAGREYQNQCFYFNYNNDPPEQILKQIQMFDGSLGLENFKLCLNKLHLNNRTYQELESKFSSNNQLIEFETTAYLPTKNLNAESDANTEIPNQQENTCDTCFNSNNVIWNGQVYPSNKNVNKADFVGRIWPQIMDPNYMNTVDDEEEITDYVFSWLNLMNALNDDEVIRSQDGRVGDIIQQKYNIPLCYDHLKEYSNNPFFELLSEWPIIENTEQFRTQIVPNDIRHENQNELSPSEPAPTKTCEVKYEENLTDIDDSEWVDAEEENEGMEYEPVDDDDDILSHLVDDEAFEDSNPELNIDIDIELVDDDANDVEDADEEMEDDEEADADEDESGLELQITFGQSSVAELKVSFKGPAIFAMFMPILVLIFMVWLPIRTISRVIQNCVHRSVQVPEVHLEVFTPLDYESEAGGQQEQGDSILCNICLSNYQVDDILRILPCSHKFHKSCIEHWLTLRNTCPVCRVNP